MLSPRAAELKAEANNPFKRGAFDKAFDVFSAAISEENQSPALCSSRSATAMKMKNFDQALRDAEKAVKVSGTFAAHENLLSLECKVDGFRQIRCLKIWYFTNRI